MDGLYLNTHELKGKQREKVEASKDLAFLSKKLATINTNVPVEFNPDDLIRVEMNKDAVRDLFEELEFRRLTERWFGKDLPKSTNVSDVSIKIDPPKTGQIDLFSTDANDGQKSIFNSSYKTIETTNVNYKLVDNVSDCFALVEKLMILKSFAFDTETSSLNALEAEIVGLSFCYKAEEAYYIPTSTNPKERDKILSIFKPLFENERIEKVGQNIKYDYHILANYGIKLKGQLFDTMIAHYLLQADMRHNMTVLAET